METFVALNGLRFPVSDADAVTVMLEMAAGDIEDAACIDWVRANVST
jgi:prophage maintenance system killer protein